MAQLTQAAIEPAQFYFEEGIIGVARARRFRLEGPPDAPVRTLSCLDVDGVELSVIDPHLADPDYRPRLSPRVVQALKIRGEEPLILAIASPDGDGTVANLRAPLVINLARRIGAQVILEDRTQPVRARLASN